MLIAIFVEILTFMTMANLLLPLYSWGNGAFIMVAVFGLVIAGLIGAVMFLMNSDKKKKNDQ